MLAGPIDRTMPGEARRRWRLGSWSSAWPCELATHSAGVGAIAARIPPGETAGEMGGSFLSVQRCGARPRSLRAFFPFAFLERGHFLRFFFGKFRARSFFCRFFTGRRR
jgi:hypothetical protein